MRRALTESSGSAILVVAAEPELPVVLALSRERHVASMEVREHGVDGAAGWRRSIYALA